MSKGEISIGRKVQVDFGWRSQEGGAISIPWRREKNCSPKDQMSKNRVLLIHDPQRCFQDDPDRLLERDPSRYKELWVLR